MALILNTLLYCTMVCAVSVPIGALLAVLIVKVDVVGRRLLAASLGILLLLPVYVVAAAWFSLFGRLGWLAWIPGSFDRVNSWVGAVGVQSIAVIPWVVLIVSIGLMHVESELEEHASLDAEPIVVLGYISLSRSAWAVVTAALWVAVVSATDMTITDLFQIRTYAEAIYTELALSGWIESSPGTLAGGMAVTLPSIAAALFVCRRLFPRGGLELHYSRNWRWRPGRARLPLAGIVLLATIVLLAVPVGSLVAKAGTQVEWNPAGPRRVWSLSRTMEILAAAPWQFGPEACWSAAIAGVAATAAVAAATPLAWWARASQPAQTLIVLTAAIGLALPAPLLGLGLIGLLNRPEFPRFTVLYDETAFAPWLAQTIRCFPLTILLVWHVMASIPVELTDQLAVEGLGPWAQLRRFAWRLCWQALLAAWLLALLFSSGELAATILVVPPGMVTLPVRVFGLLHFGVEDRMAGICLWLIGSAATAVLVVCTLAKRVVLGSGEERSR